MAVSAEQHVLYFGFGSNMSTWRINKNCPVDSPEPQFVAPARLDGYILEFCGHWGSWGGAPATILPGDGESHVWGVLWRVTDQHLARLDEQEAPTYKRIEVTVKTASENSELPEESHTCYTYVFRDESETSLPSKVYLDTLIEGAKEHKLPGSYIAELMSRPHNGYSGTVNPP